METSLNAQDKIKGFIEPLTIYDVNSTFIDHNGNNVTLVRENCGMWDADNGYGYDANGIAWGVDRICSILVKRK